ncbi:hypothetical protein QBC46DRAFT_454314 [Diplogelasinospora grovesii]|uniref:Uncharacterized protein n=1 Tax=Diplogelasinospora grovesii TaxID=303347 RepID=A0AAN6MVI3_9PEZI|nr:hypothetical protein QBC46DRAFT_454314 [Diplogelasinospora grovesii]
MGVTARDGEHNLPPHDLPSPLPTKSPHSVVLSSGQSDSPGLDSWSSSAHTDDDGGASDGKQSQWRASSFLRRRFGSSMWVRKRQLAAAADGSDDDGRGSLGLRLLFDSPEPLIDLIFVQGLRGGSVKSWRGGWDPMLFWPQHWLPMQTEFRNARIHSFGYDSDWSSTGRSVLNVHEFGRALFEEMRSSPHLRRNPTAYNLAHQDAGHQELSNRIRCIFFLVTPHRASDYAALLNGIPRLINEEFGKYAESLLVYSFYETLPTRLGISSATTFVDKNSAVLGQEGTARVNEIHFFVPSEFVVAGGDVLPIQTVDDEFLFCLYDKLAVLTHGLEFQELVTLGLSNSDQQSKGDQWQRVETRRFAFQGSYDTCILIISVIHEKFMRKERNCLCVITASQPQRRAIPVYIQTIGDLGAEFTFQEPGSLPEFLPLRRLFESVQQESSYGGDDKRLLLRLRLLVVALGPWDPHPLYGQLLLAEVVVPVHPRVGSLADGALDVRGLAVGLEAHKLGSVVQPRHQVRGGKTAT